MKYLLEQPYFTQLEISPLLLSHTATLCELWSRSLSQARNLWLEGDVQYKKTGYCFLHALSLPLLHGCLRGAMATPVCQGVVPPAQQDAVLPLSPLCRQTAGDWARGEQGLCLAAAEASLKVSLQEGGLGRLQNKGKEHCTDVSMPRSKRASRIGTIDQMCALQINEMPFEMLLSK